MKVETVKYYCDVCNKEVFDLSISINKVTSAIMPFIAIILNFIMQRYEKNVEYTNIPR